jgi:outer membrane biosynthesis protein TonB
MLRFASEGHGLAEPENQLLAAQEQIRWFRMHLGATAENPAALPVTSRDEEGSSEEPAPPAPPADEPAPPAPEPSPTPVPEEPAPEPTPTPAPPAPEPSPTPAPPAPEPSPTPAPEDGHIIQLPNEGTAPTPTPEDAARPSINRDVGGE